MTAFFFSKKIQNAVFVVGVFILLFSTFHATAQVMDDEMPKKEVKVGYGVASFPEIGGSLAFGLGTALGAVVGLGVGDVITVLVGGQPQNITVTRIEDKSTFYGTFQVGYNRFVKKRLSLGFQANYTPFVLSNIVYYSNGTSSISNRQSLYFIQAFGRLDFHYVLKPRFQMYSGLLAGTLYSSDTRSFFLSAHANLLGFRFGKSHAFYTELGLGFSSTLTAGYSARF
jgi:hypothetical protein